MFDESEVKQMKQEGKDAAYKELQVSKWEHSVA